MTRVIFPLGHYIGPFYPEQHAPLRHHIVRVGRETPKLADDTHMAVWALLHGPGPTAGGEGPAWTRQVVESICGDLDITGAARLVDELLHTGAAVEVDSHGDGLLEFAHAYRLRALLHGLGNTAEDHGRYGIGIPHVGPIVTVSIQEYELWQWAPVVPTLWDAYEMLTQVWRRTGAIHSLNTDPTERLRHDVENLTLHKLLGHGAAYLDEASATARV